MRREREVLTAAKTAVAGYVVLFQNAIHYQQTLPNKVEATTCAIDKQTAAERRFEAVQKAAAEWAEQRTRLQAELISLAARLAILP